MSRCPPLPAIDVEVLRAYLGNPDDDVLNEFMEAYRESARELVARLRDAATRAQWPEVERAAHRLKSSSSVIGAYALASACANLERAVGEGENSALRAMKEFDASADRVATALDALFTHSDAN